MTQEKVYYFDHAASSWPKPPEVVQAMVRSVEEYAANPGRGSHRMAVQASRALFDARKRLARLFRIANPNDIAFSLNTTSALNLAIMGLLEQGDHVISTGVEHNSVRRPLEYMVREHGVQVSYVGADEKGRVRLEEIEDAIRPNTKLIACTHSSNLLGSILPVGDIGALCRARGIRFLVDAAQSAGILPIDVQAMGIDLLAFPGHKGLLGPQGTGGLYIHPEIPLRPLLYGGTGSQSEAIDQPLVRPDRYESGTPNTPGIAGLAEGVRKVLETGVESIHRKEWELSQRMMEGLLGIEGLQVLGPDLGDNRTGIVSFLVKGMDASEMAFILDQSYQIAVRAGYHCTPLAHQTAGTTETGAVRASVGFYTTEAEVDHLIQAVKEISRSI